tara:strand:- start:532 stop:765 length:234 start_codon:yes stop_codon:yes gene_type:complete
MKKPNRKKQHKDLERGKKKRAKQLKKNLSNKVKSKERQDDNIRDRQARKETFKLEEEIRSLQNRGLSYRKPLTSIED